MIKIKMPFVILMALMLLLLILISCSNEETRQPGNSDTSGAGTGDTGSLPSFDSLPAINFEGMEFTIANMEGYTWIDVTLDLDMAETGEILDYAIYRRNRIVEEKYNMTLNVVDRNVWSMSDTIRNQMLAGHSEYELVQIPLHYAATLSVEGYIADAGKLPGLDLSNPWWDHFANQSTSIAERQFFLFGDFTIADKEYATAVFFNKTMHADFDLPDYYQMVRDGTWTIDNMLVSMRAVTQDINGDGVWSSEDQYGLVANAHSIWYLFYSAGETLTRKDSDDMPYWTVQGEAFANAFRRMTEFMHTNNSTAEAFSLDSHQDIMFAAGKALFDATLLSVFRVPEGGTQSFREVEFAFGLLPPPKLNEQQEHYFSFMDADTPCIAIINNDDTRIERAAVILEALNAKSSEEVQSRYREQVLPVKHFRDEESFEMLDIILTNRIFCLSNIFRWGGFEGSLRPLVVNNRAERLVSMIERNMDRANAAMQETLDKIFAN